MIFTPKRLLYSLLAKYSPSYTTRSKIKNLNFSFFILIVKIKLKINYIFVFEC